MRAETEARNICRISRGEMLRYVENACQLMEAPLRAIGMGNGRLQIVVELSPSIALSDFVAKLKSMTSSLIKPGNYLEYWAPENWVAAISPEDSDEIARMIEENDADDGIQSCIQNAGLQIMPFIIGEDILLCHHLILLTNGGKLSLRLNYQLLLECAIKDICQEQGLLNAKACGHRNHMHILCNVPSSYPISLLINTIKDRLLQWMLANRHFRKFVGWEHAIAFTVSQKHVPDEHCVLMHQDEIHRPFTSPNEMAFLSTKLRIPFFLPLK